MKLPEKSPDWELTLKEESKNVFSLIKDKEIFKLVIEFNKKYYYWSELKYRINDKKKQKYIWTLMKFLRSEKTEDVPIKSINSTYNLLPDINKKLHQFDKYLAGNIGIQSEKLELDPRHIISSLMEEAIASSILEGAATTRHSAKEMLRQKRKPKNKDEQMIVNGYETMQMILKKKNEKLTPEFLIEIQTNITKNTLDNEKDVGKFRDTNEIIVGDSVNSEIIYHVPPDHNKISQLVEELCEFANNDEEFVHPIIKGTILHFLIGYIHPFNDGNGRTARSVFYWYVLSRGYWLFQYMALSRRILRSKKDYGLSYIYTECDEMDLTYFIKYIVSCIDDALNDLTEYIKLKQKEQQQTKLILDKLTNINFRQAMILKEIMKHPNKYFTIKQISETYRVVYQTARTDLLSLVKKGYLNIRTIGRTFLFSFDESNRDKVNELIVT